MKKIILYTLLFTTIIINAQTNVKAFKKGEWLKFRISYSNFLNAGNATMEVKETVNNGNEVFHVVGKGKTTGVISWFFKVRDNYQSYFYKETLQPYRFIRKINEGGYTKDKEILFDHSSKKAVVKDYKHNTQKQYTINNNVQDMLSTLYFLRNQDLSKMKTGDEIKLTMFFDQTNYKFKLKILGREVIRTKFGKVATVKLRPIVQSGRVFKEDESLTVWVSDDENKIPLRIKASLAVGSMRVDLNAYKGLANPFPIIFN
ncbi:MAG TPA: DUF3108 domain-containing protein [Flavobacteriia bacterium]|nr:DUF3108 domain-containing protein [Flavobacteriia bacterium]